MSATTAAPPGPVTLSAAGPFAAPAGPSKPEEPNRWVDAELLPCRLSAEIQLAKFTVRDLFSLEVDSIVDSGWVQNLDVPLKANSQVIGWAEFEVIDERLAVRLTELY